jgi:hypothetical protein
MCANSISDAINKQEIEKHPPKFIHTIVQYIENINAKNHNEWLFLQKRNATPNQRLGCQIYVKKGEVEIEY